MTHRLPAWETEEPAAEPSELLPAASWETGRRQRRPSWGTRQRMWEQRASVAGGWGAVGGGARGRDQPSAPFIKNITVHSLHLE